MEGGKEYFAQEPYVAPGTSCSRTMRELEVATSAVMTLSFSSIPRTQTLQLGGMEGRGTESATHS